VTWGEGRQGILLKYYTITIVSFDEASVSSNSSNVGTTFPSSDCGGKKIINS